MITCNSCFRNVPIFFFLLLLLAPVPRSFCAPPELSHGLTYEHPVPIKEYLVSEKLDGVRAYWDGKNLLSRQGNKFAAPSWFTRDFPAVQLDGELWISRNNFEKVVSVIRKKHPIDHEWRNVQYMLFELPDGTGTFASRYRQLQTIVKKSQNPYIKVIPQIKLADTSALENLLTKVIDKGGEGLMLHRAQSLYVTGRTHDILKVKRFFDGEATVIAHLPGKGRNTGKLGAIEVRTEDGMQFKIGTGFSDEQRADPPKIGSTITFKYFGKTKNGIPRFASFLRVRPENF